MDKIIRLTTEQRSNLVAYLDGELDEEATQEIERVLARSPVARADVELLTRTWEMLDILPSVKASEDFTQKTITSLRVEEVREPLTAKPWFEKARRTGLAAGWLAGVALAAVFGFLITNRWVPNEADLLLRDLPIVENLDLYREIGDVDFLRELRRSRLLEDRAKSTN